MTVVLDTSAVAAVIFGEPDAEGLLAAMTRSAGDLLLSAATAVELGIVVEARQGYKIGCVEEIAWRAGWIDDDAFAALGDDLLKSGYGTYLHTCLARGRSLS